MMDVLHKNGEFLFAWGISVTRLLPHVTEYQSTMHTFFMRSAQFDAVHANLLSAG